MYRHIYEKLQDWKETTPRKPLILKGVRQCGKTWILKKFAEDNFDDVAYFTFDEDKLLSNIFERDLEPDRILKELGDKRRKPIDESKTVLIFDEIQFCSKALSALKYFNEQKPNLAILCAGSLLGTTLAKPLSFPVGKVTFLTLRPMNFTEFLLANNQQYLCDALNNSAAESLSPVLCEQLKDWYKDFIYVGGMPESVQTWVETHSHEKVDEVLSQILTGYELDFAKHAPSSDIPKLSAIWRQIPSQLSKENRKFTYSQVLPGGRARNMNDALEWLIATGMVTKVEAVDKPLFPLSLACDHSCFKVYLCDVGLLRKLSGFPIDALFSDIHEFSYMRGAIAENFVLNEIADAVSPQVYFWRSSNIAEVEFLIQYGMYFIPIEVKAGVRTGGKSLAVYREKFSPEFSFRLSWKNPGKVLDENRVLFLVPIPASSQILKYVDFAR